MYTGKSRHPLLSSDAATPATPRALSHGDSQNPLPPSPGQSVCLCGHGQRFRGYMIQCEDHCSPPTPRTQEIPLLLLRGSVVAACLCVHFCGTDPVCMCQHCTAFSGGGLQYRRSNEPINPPLPPPRDTHKKSYTNTTTAFFSGRFQTLLLAEPRGSPFFHWSPCLPHTALLFGASASEL